MSQVKEKAENKANTYVKYALGDTPAHDEAFSAKEDYIAGFMDGNEVNEHVLKFCRQQLEFICRTAGEKGEIHSQALIKYVLDRIK